MGGIGVMLRGVLGLGLLATAAAAGGQQAAGEPTTLDVRADVPARESPLAGFPGLGRTYHHVSGRTVEQIRASLMRLDLADSVSGEPIEAYTEWYMRWWIPVDEDGECLLDEAEVLLDVTVALPRLVNADALPADLRRSWQAYLAALEAHEATHVRNAFRARSALVRAIRQADCESAEAIFAEGLEALTQRNAEYDRRTRHGMAEGVRFP